MDVKQLTYFARICKDKSFTKAARNLHITQQGLSKAIKALEEELGASLFYRTLNGIILTEAGEYLLEHSRHIIEEFEHLFTRVNEISGVRKAKVNVGFSYGTLQSLSVDLIEEFRKKHPEVELVAREYPDILCDKAVFDHEVDCGFGIAPIDGSKFDSTVIQTNYLRLLVHKKNPLSSKAWIEIADLKQEELITGNENFKTYQFLHEKCKEQGFSPNLYLTVAELSTTYALCNLNYGVGITVDRVADSIQYPEIISLPFRDPSLVWQICLISRKGQALSPDVKRFISFLKNHLRVSTSGK